MKHTINKKYTPSGVSIDHRIKNGKTLFYDKKERADAEAKAPQMRSYMYPVFNSARRHIGYGIPK
ncbi:MAG: hypothetical protein AAF634_05020 [Bacteroidota bacterium]